jgi:prepilin-type N-terminal cleavage/methylation domain-containing protein
MTMANAQCTPRRGFTLIEVMIALVILGGVVLTMALGTTKFSASIRDSDVKNRAQSVADMQIGRARAWPTYSTLSQLSTARFNPAEDGLSSVTTVIADTTGGQSITRVTVTVSAALTASLPVPITRSIIIAAP